MKLFKALLKKILECETEEEFNLLSSDIEREVEEGWLKVEDGDLLFRLINKYVGKSIYKN